MPNSICVVTTAIAKLELRKQSCAERAKFPWLLAERLYFAWAVQRTPCGLFAGMLAIFKDLRAVHEYMFYAYRILLR